ncbi:MAG TPA: NAD(P)H dehydrogenase [Planctomycetaceae bacterium]|nr:NAD(P)H dehydrogenase [Planctomycetaceae bacterium]
MKISVILGHQRPGSFNHAIARTVCQTLRDNGHEVVFHDLYLERFDPVLPDWEIKAAEEDLPEEIRWHMREVREADGLVFVHPNWWGGPPAILRGWLDRVVRQGFAYRFTEKGPQGNFTEKSVVVFSTSNTPRDVEINVYGDPVGVFWKTIVFGLCGCKSFERRNFEPIILSTPPQRGEWLAEVADIVRAGFIP